MRGIRAITKGIQESCLMIFAVLLLTAGSCLCAETDFEPELLQIGYSSKLIKEVSIGDAQAAMELWTRELARDITIKVQPRPVVYDNLDSIIKAVKRREIALIALTTMDYLIIKDKVPLEPSIVAIRRGSFVGHELVLLVRRDQGITELDHLKGKRFVTFDGSLLEISYVWLNSLLRYRHLPERHRFFGSSAEVKKAGQAVLQVFFRQADVCLVNRSAFEAMAELNPQVGKDLVVLFSSDKLLEAVFCLNKYLSSNAKKQVMEAAGRAHKSPVGKQVFTLFKIDNLTPFTPRLLDSTAALLEKNSRLR